MVNFPKCQAIAHLAARSSNTPTQRQRQTTGAYTSQKKLCQKLQFNKSLHSSFGEFWFSTYFFSCSTVTPPQLATK
ncbi:unknown protein [Microcystis aeruginosa NIES-843]|uniref:Uncharacterized protein n=1 Tax=Microcystis aeruginosa (strain NIES-843 / IAM M-2473) TaxID=449447 RepID=B0JXM9_MICAN|nr:unknown protein [Microcystis aeruginosa NIES-843]